MSPLLHVIHGWIGFIQALRSIWHFGEMPEFSRLICEKWRIFLEYSSTGTKDTHSCKAGSNLDAWPIVWVIVPVLRTVVYRTDCAASHFPVPEYGHLNPRKCSKSGMVKGLTLGTYVNHLVAACNFDLLITRGATFFVRNFRVAPLQTYLDTSGIFFSIRFVPVWKLKNSLGRYFPGARQKSKSNWSTI